MLHLSENLKKYRILKNLTQEEVAGYLRITPQSVSKWSAGSRIRILHYYLHWKIFLKQVLIY